VVDLRMHVEAWPEYAFEHLDLCTIRPLTGRWTSSTFSCTPSANDQALVGDLATDSA